VNEIFNEVRISKPNSDPKGPVWAKSKVSTDLHRLMIHFNPQNGHVLLAERPEDEYSDEPYFIWSGHVVGIPTVDEYGITFEAYNKRGERRHIIVTRKGVYGG
jgi:hypothetical protein